MVSPIAQAKSIALLRQVSEASTTVTLDRHRFMQILYNLLSNALKFTNAGGEVSLSLDREEMRCGCGFGTAASASAPRICRSCSWSFSSWSPVPSDAMRAPVWVWCSPSAWRNCMEDRSKPKAKWVKAAFLP